MQNRDKTKKQQATWRTVTMLGEENFKNHQTDTYWKFREFIAVLKQEQYNMKK